MAIKIKDQRCRICMGLGFTVINCYNEEQKGFQKCT
jgi:hypothetical protein